MNSKYLLGRADSSMGKIPAALWPGSLILKTPLKILARARQHSISLAIYYSSQREV